LPEVICNTSPLQYLHQLDLLHILPALAGHIVVPQAVAAEVARGMAASVSLPDLTAVEWVIVRRPISAAALPLITDLGSGESEVLALALESRDPVVVIDDALARRVAAMLGIRLTGTLGLLLDAKHAGLIPAVKPALDQLRALRFRLASHTRCISYPDGHSLAPRRAAVTSAPLPPAPADQPRSSRTLPTLRDNPQLNSQRGPDRPPTRWTGSP